MRKDVIFDGKYYYFFRSLNDGNMRDLENGETNIRTDTIRYYENHGNEWGKYNTESQCSLSEVYDHIKMQYRPDTNCISLTKNPNVALTYHSKNKRYVLVRVTPEEFDKSDNIFDAGKYFYKEIQKMVEDAVKTIPEGNEVIELLNQIENTEELKQIVLIVRQVLNSNFNIEPKQYLTDEEQIKVAKLVAKIKVLEARGIINNLIKEGSNSQLIGTMGNAYSSAEVIHYGDIERERIIDCPTYLIEMLSLVMQSREKGIDEEKFQKITNIILENIKKVSDIQKGIQTEFSENSISEIDIDFFEYEFLKRDYSRKEKLREELWVEDAYKMTNGNISYRDTNIQVTAIRILSEMILKKRILTKMLKQIIPDEDVDKILEGTFCINPELIVRQNYRGRKISDTVNFLITDFGYDLDNEVAINLYEKLESLSSERLYEIYENGTKTQGIQELLFVTRNNNERISSFSKRPFDVKYMAEAIIEGYNWKGVRFLSEEEKQILASRLLNNTSKKNELKEIYDAFTRIIIGNKRFSQEEIFGAILNIALDDGVGEITYKELLESSNKSQILLSNSNAIQTTVSPLEIDLLMKRGKTLEKLKTEIESYGIAEDFINSKRIRNLYTAKSIVEEYDFGRQITDEEKGAIIFCLLNSATLDDDKHFYLNTFLKNIKDLDFSDQEAMGIIINLAISGKRLVNELDKSVYSDLIKSKNNCIELKKYRYRFKTLVSELVLESAKTKLEAYDSNIVEEYKGLGFDDFAENKHIQNLIAANKIVEQYDFGRELTTEEKNSLKFCLLKNSKLDKLSGSLISNLCLKLEEAGFNKNEVYGLVLNLSINGKIIIDNITYEFNSLLSSKDDDVFKHIGKNKKCINTYVDEITILKAQEQYLNKEQVEELKQKIMTFGIDKEFINSIDYRNLFFANEIIEKYNFGRELSTKEKKALLYSILDVSALKNETQGKCYLLSTACLNLKEEGFTEQEVFGIILNAAIGNLHTNIQECSYSSILTNSYMSAILKEKKDFIKYNVSNFSIQKAISDTMTEDDIINTRKVLVDMGINEEFLKEKYPQNMYMANYIVEHCKFQRDITKEEKSAIIKKILFGNAQNVGSNRYLSTLCLNLEQNGFEEDEICNIIVKLAVHSKLLPERGFSYSALGASVNRVIEFAKQKDRLDFSISEETLQKAQGNSIDIMKKALTQSKKKSALTAMDSVRDEISKMSGGKEQNTIEYVDTNGDKHLYSIYFAKVLFGIDDAISNSLLKQKGVNRVELLELVEYYNQTHPKTPIDIKQRLRIFEEIKSTLYRVKNENNETEEVDFDRLLELSRKKFPSLRKEYLYVYLRNMHEQGNLEKYDDIVSEIGRRLEENKSKSYLYLYPNKNGNLEETSLNSIVRDYREKNPNCAINFDIAKKYIEKAIEMGATPEEAVSKGFELYNLEARKVQRFLLRNPETQKYEEVTASKIKTYWRTLGLEISKDETVLKFLKQVSEIEGIKDEEIVDKAFELAEEKIRKFDFAIDETGKTEKLTISAIATRVTKMGKKVRGPALKKAILRLKEEYADSGLTEAEIVKMAIEEANNSARKKYPIKNENGELLELTTAEIAKKLGLNRGVLAREIKKLEDDDKFNNCSKEEFIKIAIESVKSKSRKIKKDTDESR